MTEGAATQLEIELFQCNDKQALKALYLRYHNSKALTPEVIAAFKAHANEIGVEWKG